MDVALALKNLNATIESLKAPIVLDNQTKNETFEEISETKRELDLQLKEAEQIYELVMNLAEKRKKEIQEKLFSEQSEIATCKENVEKLKEYQNECLKRRATTKEAYEGAEKRLKEVESKSEAVSDKEKNLRLLKARKKLFYMVSRIVWENVSKDEETVKGFIVNVIKNDVHPFHIDRSSSDSASTREILWDYIGLGINDEYKSV